MVEQNQPDLTSQIEKYFSSVAAYRVARDRPDIAVRVMQEEHYNNKPVDRLMALVFAKAHHQYRGSVVEERTEIDMGKYQARLDERSVGEIMDSALGKQLKGTDFDDAKREVGSEIYKDSRKKYEELGEKMKKLREEQQEALSDVETEEEQIKVMRKYEDKMRKLRKEYDINKIQRTLDAVGSCEDATFGMIQARARLRYAAGKGATLTEIERAAEIPLTQAA